MANGREREVRFMTCAVDDKMIWGYASVVYRLQSGLRDR